MSAPGPAPAQENLIANCPILAGISRIGDLSQDLQRSMRQLRRDLERCKTCRAGPECPALRDYQDKITDAIVSVLAELKPLC